MPAGLPLAADDLARDLARRQLGYGRGRRMAIEQDRAEILSGVRRGETIGSPIALLIAIATGQLATHDERRGRPAGDGRRRAARAGHAAAAGHADLAGGLKYERTDLRDVLERASARETAARVAAGAIARVLLRRFGIDVASHVIGIGAAALPAPLDVTFDDLRRLAWDDDVRCVDAAVAAAMRRAIDAAKEAGDTVGGAFEVIAHHVPPGLGSHVQWDRKLDGRLAQALMSIPAIKAVGIGLAAAVGSDPGSQVHDEIVLDESGAGTIPGLRRPTNRAGGLEGGVTNGEDVRVTAWMKPISTLMKPLRSVDLDDDDRAAGGDRAQRRLRRAGGGGRRRSHGLLRPGGRLAREVRRRHHRGHRRGVAARPPAARSTGAASGPRRHDGAALMLRPIVRYGSPALATKAAPVTTFDATLHALIDDMIDTMYAAPGIGLAAPQVGVPLRVCVIDLSVGKRGGELLTLINPEFVERDGMQLEEEGCLSVPGLQRHGRAAGPRRRARRSIAPAAKRPSKARACWRARFSTRSITSTACCSSIGSAASSATSSCGRSASCRSAGRW